jgi:hypothetical protein
MNNTTRGEASDQVSHLRRAIVASTIGTTIEWYDFFLYSTASGLVFGRAIAISLVGHNMQYGPQAALIAESFPAPLRYSGASLGYQLSSVFAGGPAPLIATALYATYKSGMAVGAYIAVCAVITIVATALMRERAGVDVDVEEARPSAKPEPVTVHA